MLLLEGNNPLWLTAIQNANIPRFQIVDRLAIVSVTTISTRTSLAVDLRVGVAGMA